MHGRKKLDRPRTQEELSAIQNKIDIYKKVLVAIAKVRSEWVENKNPSTEKALVNITEKMIRINPDYYSMWNYRKEIILRALKLSNCDSMTESEIYEGAAFHQSHVLEYKDNMKRELDLSEYAISKNPKCYSAWHHRRWVLDQWSNLIEQKSANQKGIDDQDSNVISQRSTYQNELKLCEQLLLLDGRNFHCWTYRNWVIEKMGMTKELNFSFTTEKITENFSNYSAFHYRSKILPDIIEAKNVDEKWQCIDNELDMLHQAMYTEPDDQSAWWYYRFLINFTKENLMVGNNQQTKYQDVLEKEVACMHELLGMEENCKWSLISLYSLLKSLADISTSEKALQLKVEAKSLISQLMKIDSMHCGYYESLLHS